MPYTVGDSASLTRTITADDIDRFADLTGDMNPVHLDDAAAAKSRFGKRIAHGMLGASLISTVLAMKLPGAGTIYLSQTTAFKAPVYIGDTITASVTVKAKKEGRSIYTLETTVEKQDGTVVITGEAVVLHEELA